MPVKNQMVFEALQIYCEEIRFSGCVHVKSVDNNKIHRNFRKEMKRLGGHSHCVAIDVLSLFTKTLISSSQDFIFLKQGTSQPRVTPTFNFLKSGGLKKGLVWLKQTVAKQRSMWDGDRIPRKGQDTQEHGCQHEGIEYCSIENKFKLGSGMA
jgi:hypothetical protein